MPLLLHTHILLKKRSSWANQSPVQSHLWGYWGWVGFVFHSRNRRSKAGATLWTALPNSQPGPCLTCTPSKALSQMSARMREASPGAAPIQRAHNIAPAVPGETQLLALHLPWDHRACEEGRERVGWDGQSGTVGRGGPGSPARLGTAAKSG